MKASPRRFQSDRYCYGILNRRVTAHIHAMSSTVEYVYRVERGTAGAGYTIWRWNVCCPASDAVIVSGATFRSQEAAELDAREAIAGLRLKQRRLPQSASG
jgi:hypothetical protein